MQVPFCDECDQRTTWDKLVHLSIEMTHLRNGESGVYRITPERIVKEFCSDGCRWAWLRSFAEGG